MSRVGIHVDGLDRLSARLATLEREMTSKVRDALVVSAEETRNRAVQGIAKGPKTGVIYTHRFPSVFKGGQRRAKDKRNKPHQASAVGEYPAADTGNLMRSIYTDASEIEPRATMVASVIADADYAKPLEYKPPERGGRPFMRRALEEERPATLARIVAAVLAAARSGRPPPGAPPTGSAPPTGPGPRPSPRRPSTSRSDVDVAAELNRAEAARLRGPAAPPALPPPSGGDE